MLTRGEYRTPEENYSLCMEWRKGRVELILTDSNNTIQSAYLKEGLDEYSFQSKKCKEIYRLINLGMSSCTSKNGSPIPSKLGVSNRHQFKKSGLDFSIDRHKDLCCGVEIKSDNTSVYLEYSDDQRLYKPDIPYVKLTKQTIKFTDGNEEEDIVIRTLDQIKVETDKDTTWLEDKKYYVVKDEQDAENIFSFLDNYNGPISFDTESSGLRINQFGKIGSKYKKSIDEYNESQRLKNEETIRVDYLVGIIFCVEKDVSYYFPCKNRKFKNLYNDMNNPITKKTAENILSKYMVGEYRDRTDDMANYIRENGLNGMTTDIILMERCRHILSTKALIAHNGSFEWKTCWLYHIDFSLKDDTMIMHQLMYKFRSTTSNRGESSSLKNLSKIELGVDQLDLRDFFVDFEEDNTAQVRGKKTDKKSKKTKRSIDFSYMDEEGSRVYAPADGDLTLQIFIKYKTDMRKNHSKLEYLYNVELLTACAIGYMEFYGHRIDEEQIEDVKQKSKTKLIQLEYQFRDMANLNTEEENRRHKLLEDCIERVQKVEEYIKSIKTKMDDPVDLDKMEKLKKLLEEAMQEKDNLLIEKVEKQERLKEAMNNSVNELNMAAPAQVGNLFFNVLMLPSQGDTISVAKKELKRLLSFKNSDGTYTYPIVEVYSEWKKIDTLLSKFFDNLPYFMYNGGFIFSGYGQISTATGRMSCSKPRMSIGPLYGNI